MIRDHEIKSHVQILISSHNFKSQDKITCPNTYLEKKMKKWTLTESPKYDTFIGYMN